MANNNYPIAANFPNGLNLDVLIQEMPSVWPADLFPAVYLARGRPGPTGITSGSLQIETPRALTTSEDDDALAHFLVHAGGSEVPNLKGFQLPAASDAKGTWTFLADEPKSPNGNGTLGTMVYSDGENWLTISDNKIATTV